MNQKQIIKKMFEQYKTKNFSTQKKADDALWEITKYAENHHLDDYLTQLIVETIDNVIKII